MTEERIAQLVEERDEARRAIRDLLGVLAHGPYCHGPNCRLCAAEKRARAVLTSIPTGTR